MRNFLPRRPYPDCSFVSMATGFPSAMRSLPSSGIIPSAAPSPMAATLSRWPPIVWALAGTALTFALGVWLQWLGRSWLGDQGFNLWDNGFGGAGNSQSLLDPYALLHLSFGMILLGVLRFYRLSWPAAMQACTAFAGLAAWEAVENVPAVIALFHPPTGASSYGGDSLLNVAGDLVAGMLGFLAARHWSGARIMATLIAIEGMAGVMIGDGLLIGSLRMIGLA